MLKKNFTRRVVLFMFIFFVAATAVITAAQPVSDSIFAKIITDSTNAKTENGLPVQLSVEANKFATAYINENKHSMQRTRQRIRNYFPIIDTIFSHYHLPEELHYLAIVESNLDPQRKSHAGALGLWQLMPAAAKTLGLKVQPKLDERRHAYKSTVAAAKLLKQLYKEFDDWLLAVAAYNSGSGNVRKAIRKSGSRDFWEIQKYLPLETRKHVKRFISVQYYFDGKVSEISLTKKELEKHKKAEEEYLAKQNVDTLPVAAPEMNEAIMPAVMEQK